MIKSDRFDETKSPITETPPDKTDKVDMYDEAGNILLTTDRSGRQVRRTYDVLNRLTQVDYLWDGRVEKFNFDSFGDMYNANNADVSYDFLYTVRHQIKQKLDSRSGGMTYQYDGQGNLKSKTDYQGQTTKYQYDAANRIDSAQNPAYLNVTYRFDPAGRLEERQLSNGAATQYHHNSQGFLDGFTNKNITGGTMPNFTIIPKANGMISKQTDSDGYGNGYYYDANNRLTLVTGFNSFGGGQSEVYTYDAVGNRKTAKSNAYSTFDTRYYCYDATDCTKPAKGNRLINIRTGSTTGPIYRQFTYDDSGRILTKKDGSGAVIYSITYNGKGEASAITTPSGTNTLAYDPFGYRIKKVDSSGTKQYLLEGEHLETTLDATGKVMDKYFRGAVIDEIVNAYHYPSPANTKNWKNQTFFHNHSNNNVTALIGPTGNVDEQNTYDAFGNLITSSGTGGNNLLFSGREIDRDSKLYYFRARYYDSEIGRFITEDKKGFAAGVNFYVYCNNDGINCRDPSGNYAEVDVNGDKINITIPIRYTGDGKTEGNVRLYNSGIENTWGNHGETNIGDFKVNTQVKELSWVESLLTSNEHQNIINITPLNQMPAVGHYGYVDGCPACTGQWPASVNIAGLGLGAIGAHEAGHLMGLPDAPKGTVGEIMGAFDPLQGLAPVRPQDIQNVIDANSAASGGYVLYPNKPNTNSMQAVYHK